MQYKAGAIKTGDGVLLHCVIFGVRLAQTNARSPLESGGGGGGGGGTPHRPIFTGVSISE